MELKRLSLKELELLLIICQFTKIIKKNNGVHSIIEGIIDFLILTIVVIVSLIIMEKKECLI